MRLSRSISVALAAAVLAMSVSEPAQARRPRRAYAAAPVPPQAQPLVSLSLVRPGGGMLPSYVHLGSLYFAGQQGERYDLQLTNNTGGRVEVVITVDGRDVISGELGNYKRQRGHVIEPWDTVVVEGFRQSLDQVAAFRFSSPAQSYTGLRGTPQHAGVVGVAVFEESKRSARRHRRAQAKAQPTPPVYEPYYRGEAHTPVPSAFPESRPRSEAEAEDAAVEIAPTTADAGAFSPPAPEPRVRQLGTAYGESHFSAVEEVAFKRHRRRRPDALLTVYYDSMDGLSARGITHSIAPPPPAAVVRPGFAAPPR